MKDAMVESNNPPRCPYCKTDNPPTVRIIRITKDGVVFKCPNHGISSLRHDCMTDTDRKRLRI
jgi:predicted RNA-binding Zn-ribbon protein involved in translation (DUF1610 family)